MNKSDKEKMILMYKQGIPKTKIAKELGCSTATILRNLRVLGQDEKIDPMIGQTFGYLTVIEPIEKQKNIVNRCIYYKCQCKCGSIVTVNGSALRSGHTKSCGCLRKENQFYKDLTGQTYGLLTVLYLTDGVNNDDRRKMWHCKCECGQECDVSSHLLISGSTKSCGCLKSWKENEIKNILNSLNINYQQQYHFEDLRGIKNPLYFDFAIMDKQNNLQCLIEYQGDQHYDINNSWHTDLLEDYDNRKKEYCKNKNIPLYELNKYSDCKKEIERISKIYGC